jgi:glycine/D-amino acid oxidase-like deaminating enzyme
MALSEIGVNTMQTVAVIGAGVVGASLAFRLAQSGSNVILIDRADPGRGTSGSSFAWTNANLKLPRDYFELNYAGMRAHVALRNELGAAPWLHEGGNLVWQDDESELADRVARLQSWGYVAEIRSAADAQQTLEPNVRFARPDAQLAYFPEEGWIDAPLLASSMTERARQLGAQTLFGTTLESIEVENGRVAAVTLGQSGRLPVDAVVNAAGTGADKVAALVGRTLPLAPTTGLLVRVAVAPAPVHRVVHTPDVHLRPDGEGFVLLHHDDTDHQLGERRQVSLDDPLVRELFTRAQRAVDGFDNASVVDARIGTRPYPADGRTCAGAVSALPGYYEAVTHSGVTLCALLGKLLARTIISGEVDPLLSAFSPDRFG